MAWSELGDVLDEAARLEFVDGESDAAARLLERKAEQLEAASLKALALAHAAATLARVGSARAEATAAQLRALPAEAVVAAGPIAIECVLAQTDGAHWITAVADAGLLEEVPVARCGARSMVGRGHG